MSDNLLGFIFVVMGGWAFFAPKSALDFKIEISKVFGMKISYGKKTVTYYKYFGGIIAALGLFMLLGFI